MKIHVLIVDDDPWFAQQQARVLKGAGMTTHVVGDALAAMDAVDQHRPNVIVLDMLLPAANGMVLLHELASHTDLADIPIVVCSTLGAELMALQAHPNLAVLDKTTMHPDDITAAVRRLLS